MAAVEMFPWIAHYSGVMICLNSKKITIMVIRLFYKKSNRTKYFFTTSSDVYVLFSMKGTKNILKECCS